MMNRLVFISAVLAMSAGIAACDAPKANVSADAVSVDAAQRPKGAPAAAARGSASKEVAAKEAKKKPSFHYSPFVLKVSSQESVFKTISFKDVGVHGLADAERDVLYETIAESLAYKLSQAQDLSMTSRVVYDEEILDPNNHLACGSHHLYVDIWRSSKTRWGYSLWSGCGEDDNFEWKELSVDEVEVGDLVEEVNPLTKGIVESLRAANARGCYQKTC